MPYRDLRQFLDFLETKQQLTRVKKEVDWNLELSHVAKLNEMQGGPALLFENVKDYPGKRVAHSVLATKERLAYAIGAPSTGRFMDICETWVSRTADKKVPPKWVENAPWRENTFSGDRVNLYDLPAPWFYPKDATRYLGTCGCVICRNLKTGRINVGTHRGMLVDKDRMTLYLITGKHAELDLRDYVKAGQPMPVAWVTGVDPALFVCSGSAIPYDTSEYDVAGALRGEPIEVTKGMVVDLPIPAGAEIVIEGELDPWERLPEGPFSEHPGVYGASERPQPYITVKSISYRNNPILWAAPVGTPVTEDHLIYALARNFSLWRDLHAMGIPGLKGLYAPPAGTGRMLAIVSVQQMYPGHSTQVGLAAFASHTGDYGLKFVIVVDDDIDPENWDQVIYALSYRCQPETDIQILRRGRNTPLDPSMYGIEKTPRLTSRVLIDACIPYEWEEKPPLTRLDDEVLSKVKSQWDSYFEK